MKIMSCVYTFSRQKITLKVVAGLSYKGSFTDNMIKKQGSILPSIGMKKVTNPHLPAQHRRKHAH